MNDVTNNSNKQQMGGVNALSIPDPIVNIDYQGLSAKSKVVPKVTFDINLTNMDLDKETSGGRSFISRFRDPRTGYYVLNLPSVMNLSERHLVDVEFYQLVQDILTKAWEIKYNELNVLHKKDPDKYQNSFKDLDNLDFHIRKQINNLNTIAEMVITKARSLVSRKNNIAINQRLAFQDTTLDISDQVTGRVPYNTPSISSLEISDDKFKRVYDFLSVFMDDDNLQIFLWYFGALVSNVDVHKISKMLVVSSSKGGNGKNTFIEAVCNALFTQQYYNMHPTFDEYFARNNRFGLGNFMPLHVNVFGEAEWSIDGGDGKHDFSGMSVDRIKSLISDGIYTSEAKFANAENAAAPNSFYIVLTNHFPEITVDNQALNRRLLALSLRPSSMAEKGIQLGAKDRQEVFKQAQDLAQDLADICYTFYQKNPRMYLNTEYNKLESIKAIQEADNNYQDAKNKQMTDLRELGKKDPVAALTELAEQQGLNLDKIIDLAKTKSEVLKVLRWDKLGNGHKVLYLNSTKSVITSATGDANVRKVLKDTFGNPVKKFGMRMFKIG